MSRISVFTAALMLPAAAFAQPLSGPYTGIAAGADFPLSPSAAAGAMNIAINPGPLGLMNLGWGFGNGLRAEIEGSYRSNRITGASAPLAVGQSRPLNSLSGRATGYAVMGNLIYDLPFRPFGLPVRPYIGAGIGYGWLNFSGVKGAGTATVSLPNHVVIGPSPDVVGFGSTGALAYQSILGVSVPLAIVPGLDLTLEYRFFGMAHTEIPVTGTITGGPLAGASSQSRYGFQSLNNTVLIGLRYAFNGP